LRADWGICLGDNSRSTLNIPAGKESPLGEEVPIPGTRGRVPRRRRGGESASGEEELGKQPRRKMGFARHDAPLRENDERRKRRATENSDLYGVIVEDGADGVSEFAEQ
jgi:hypothetical protein